MNVRRLALTASLLALSACDGLATEEAADRAVDVPAAPEASTCAPRDAAPPSAEELTARGLDLGFRPRAADPGEEDGGLVLPDRSATLAPAAPSLVAGPTPGFATVGDSDGDCLPDKTEVLLGTSPTNPDTDGDGWFDGPCNERRRLVLTQIKAYDEEEDIGEDELYLVADDRRFPTDASLDGYWEFDDGEVQTFALTLAQRVRGKNTTGALATVQVEGFDDDAEVVNTWWADDGLFDMTLNLGAYAPGQSFSVRRTMEDWDYLLTFRVDVDRFADPTPKSDGDSDQDGIKDSAEYAVSRDLGGIADPTRAEVLVELDAMAGHALETRARRLVTTRLAVHGLTLEVRPDETLGVDSCLTRTEARALFDQHFGLKGTHAFRYAVMTEVIWNDASGVAIGDTFFMDDSTWWIDGGVLPQAGTFIHELGHTLGLTKSLFALIDTIASPTYDSAMNYFWQPSKVDYSDSGAGGKTNDFDDWSAVKPARGLAASFGSTSVADDGVCH